MSAAASLLVLGAREYFMDHRCRRLELSDQPTRRDTHTTKCINKYVRRRGFVTDASGGGEEEEEEGIR